MSTTLAEPTTNVLVPVAPPSVPMPVPDAPTTETDQALASLAANPAQARTSTSFKEILAAHWPDQIQKAQAEAADLFPKMLENSALVSTYGLDRLSGVNATADRLLKELDNDISIPQLEAIMNDLLDNLDSLRRGYDLNNPDVKKDFESYQKGKSFFAKFFRRGRNWFRKFREDMMSLYSKINKVDKQLAAERDGLVVRVVQYDDVYKQMSGSIDGLVYVGAVMEYIHDTCLEQAANIQSNGSDLADDQREQKGRVEDLGGQLEIKINAFLTRLFVAYATMPQVRMMRKTDQTLILQVDTIRGSTLYTMRLQCGLWLGNAKDAAASKQAEAAIQSANQVAQQFGQSLGVTLPEMERRAQMSDLTPESILAMANGVATAAQGIQQAIREGRQEREQVKQAIVQAAGIIGDASKQLDDTFLEGFVGDSVRKAEAAEAASTQALETAQTALPPAPATQ